MKPPSRITGIIKIFITMYLFGLAMTGTLGFKLFYDKTHQNGSPPRFESPDWFYWSYIFVFPILIGVVGLWVFLWETRYRQNDPYRFSRRQYRFIEVNSQKFSIVSEELVKLGYYIFFEHKDEISYRLEGGRVKISNLSTFKEKRHPSSFRIFINAQRLGETWRVIVEAVPVNSLAVADFRNTIFDSLEELVDVLNWRNSLKVQFEPESPLNF